MNSAMLQTASRFTWKYSIIKYQSKIYTPIQLLKHLSYTSNKFTRYTMHRRYIVNCMNNLCVPKGMLHTLPITIGSKDKNLINNIKTQDYKNGIEECRIFLRWYPQILKDLRSELFTIKNKISYILPAHEFKLINKMLWVSHMKEKKSIEKRHNCKIKRDVILNTEYRTIYNIEDDVFKVELATLDENIENINISTSQNVTETTFFNTELEQGGTELVSSDRTSQHEVTVVDNCLPSELNVIKDVQISINHDISDGTVSNGNYKAEKYYPVNLSKDKIDPSLQKLCSLGKSFVVTNSNINRVQMEEGFENWALRLRRTAYFHSRKFSGHDVRTEREKMLKVLESKFVKSDFKPPSTFHNAALETYIQKVKKELFDPKNMRHVHSNISKEESLAITKCRNDKDHIIRIQDKGGKFTFNKTDSYIAKMEETILDPNNFKILSNDPTKDYLQRISIWAKLYLDKGQLSEKLASWFVPSKAAPGAIYGMDKTHKNPPTLRTITSACGTGTENLANFVASFLKPVVEDLPFIIKDTYHFLKLINDLNTTMQLPVDFKLVTIDIINMFPSISNDKGLKAVKPFLDKRLIKFPSTKCIMDALIICLESNCSQFGDKFITQTEGAATGPRYVCDYADIALAEHDIAISEYDPQSLLFYGRYRDDVMMIWGGNDKSLNAFFVFINSLDPNIQFTMKKSDESIDYLDVRIYVNEGKLETTVYSKPTDGHVYLNPKSNHPRHQIEAIPKSQALRLRKIISVEEDFKRARITYTQYFLDRGYRKGLVEKAFEEVSKMDRLELLNNTLSKKSIKISRTVFPLVIEHNPKLPPINKILKSNLNILHTDDEMHKLFSSESIFWAAKRGKNLKEILVPSRYNKPGIAENLGCKVNECGKNCNLCSFLLHTEYITSFSTKEKFKIKCNVHCNSKNVIYCINDINCKLQNVGSTINMKKRFCSYKSHIKSGCKGCNLYIHWHDRNINKPHLSTNPVPQKQNDFNTALKKEMQVVILEEVNGILSNDSDLEISRKLKQREVIWQTKLNSWVPYGLNVRDEGFSVGN